MTERDAERIELAGGWHFRRPRNHFMFELRSPSDEMVGQDLWAPTAARAFAAAIRPEPSADAGGEAAKLVDAALRARTLYDEARTDVAHSNLVAARAALLDHIAGLKAENETLSADKERGHRYRDKMRAEIERYRAAYEVEKKYSALRCDEVARLTQALAAKDAEIERLTTEAHNWRNIVMDMHQAIGVAWGDDVYAELARLKVAQVPEELREIARTPEDLASFLHDEIHGHDWTWPEHEDDTGKREGGYVRLTPTDIRLECREQAGRIWRFLRLSPLLASKPAPAQASPDDALREALDKLKGRFCEWHHHDHPDVKAVEAALKQGQFKPAFEIMEPYFDGEYPGDPEVAKARAALNPTGEA